MEGLGHSAGVKLRTTKCLMLPVPLHVTRAATRSGLLQCREGARHAGVTQEPPQNCEMKRPFAGRRRTDSPPERARRDCGNHGELRLGKPAPPNFANSACDSECPRTCGKTLPFRST